VKALVVSNMKSKEPIDILLDDVKWEPIVGSFVDSSIPFATHQGLLKIGELQLKVYQLSDGQRVLDMADVERLLGITL
jgi:hypothetical protein